MFLLKVSKADDSKSFLQLSDTVNEAIRYLKTIGLEFNALSDSMIVNFILTKLQNSVKQH